jgi:hypothetical protein
MCSFMQWNTMQSFFKNAVDAYILIWEEVHNMLLIYTKKQITEDCI